MSSYSLKPKLELIDNKAVEKTTIDQSLSSLETVLEEPLNQPETFIKPQKTRIESVKDRSIQAVVSLLDEEANNCVKEIWAGLENEFGLQKIYAAPFPHFSYHTSERYDEDIEERLRALAVSIPPFEIHVSGLGIFPTPKPIVYLVMVRSTALNRCHEAIWTALATHAYSANLHYHPEAWVPHITLAQGDLSADLLPDAIAYLANYTLDMIVRIDNLALVFAEGLEQGLKQKFPLGGQNTEVKPIDMATTPKQIEEQW